jgi:hypothetical protein
MVVLNRIAVVLVLAGALLYGLRDGADEAIDGHPEALWHTGVDEVDTVISDGTEKDVSKTFDYVTNLAE